MSEPSAAMIRSYHYLRTAMVALLLGLGAAVGFQTWRQDWKPLDSVSGYYYTPAQAIFVGALIGLGTCMVALRGTNDLEDVLLNVGGMFAAVVAVVPTSRGDDYEALVRSCRDLAGTTPTGQNCATVDALEAAAHANVENNMFALLVVGVLGLVATVLFALRGRGPGQTRRDLQVVWWGLAVAVGVFVAALVTVLVSLDWFIGHAHFIAAFGLLGCVFAVAVTNAYRRRENRAGAPAGGATGALGRRRYTWIALAMVVVAVVGLVLYGFGVISVFVLEIAVALLFAIFWMVQTVEQMDSGN